MKCQSCQHDNPPQARFCAHCGSALAAPSAGKAPVATGGPSVTAVPVAAPVRISTFSAAVGFFLLGLIAAALLLFLRYGSSDYGYAPLYSAFPLTLYSASPLIVTGAGVAVALWLSGRFHLTRRLPSAMGMAFIVIGAVLAAYNYYGTHIILISSGIIGLGIGLLFPMAFWRHITEMSAGGKVTLVVAGVGGAAAGWFVSDAVTFVTGRLAIGVLAAPVALVIGLPIVLVSPILRTSRRV